MWNQTMFNFSSMMKTWTKIILIVAFSFNYAKCEFWINLENHVSYIVELRLGRYLGSLEKTEFFTFLILEVTSDQLTDPSYSINGLQYVQPLGYSFQSPNKPYGDYQKLSPQLQIEKNPYLLEQVENYPLIPQEEHPDNFQASSRNEQPNNNFPQLVIEQNPYLLGQMENNPSVDQQQYPDNYPPSEDSKETTPSKEINFYPLGPTEDNDNNPPSKSFNPGPESDGPPQEIGTPPYPPINTNEVPYPLLNSPINNQKSESNFDPSQWDNRPLEIGVYSYPSSKTNQQPYPLLNSPINLPNNKSDLNPQWDNSPLEIGVYPYPQEKPLPTMNPPTDKLTPSTPAPYPNEVVKEESKPCPCSATNPDLDVLPTHPPMNNFNGDPPFPRLAPKSEKPTEKNNAILDARKAPPEENQPEPIYIQHTVRDMKIYGCDVVFSNTTGQCLGELHRVSSNRSKELCSAKTGQDIDGWVCTGNGDKTFTYDAIPYCESNDGAPVLLLTIKEYEIICHDYIKRHASRNHAPEKPVQRALPNGIDDENEQMPTTDIDEKEEIAWKRMNEEVAEERKYQEEKIEQDQKRPKENAK